VRLLLIVWMLLLPLLFHLRREWRRWWRRNRHEIKLHRSSGVRKR
jgi:hypothetical protein